MRTTGLALVMFAAISGAAHSGEPPAADDEGETGERTLLPERLEALIDRAAEAAQQLPRREAVSTCTTRRADIATKRTALRLSLFVAELQEVRIVGLEPPPQVKLPAWVFEPPACPAWQVIDRRNDWLEAQVTRATDWVCSRAAEKTGDSLICSVE